MNKAQSQFYANETISLYVNEKMPMYKVAGKLGVSVGFVFNTLKSNGVKSRKTSDYTRGRKHTKEVREIISKTHKGKVLSPETRKKISEGHKGKYRIKTEFGGHRKERDDGYLAVYCPEHPNASADGYVMEHRLVIEKILGRYLEPDEVVHHIDENRKNNEPSNLSIFRNLKDHRRYHAYFQKARKKQCKNL